MGDLPEWLQLTGVAVDRRHLSCRSDLVGHPPGHGAGTGTEFQTVPTGAHAERPQTADGGFVVEALEFAQAGRFVVGAVPHGVAAGLAAVAARHLAKSFQPNSIWLNSRSLSRGWRALTKRTVPERERMTRDWVVAPKSW